MTIISSNPAPLVTPENLQHVAGEVAVQTGPAVGTPVVVTPAPAPAAPPAPVQTPAPAPAAPTNVTVNVPAQP